MPRRVRRLVLEQVEGPRVAVVDDVRDAGQPVHRPRRGERAERVAGGEHEVDRGARVQLPDPLHDARDPRRVVLGEERVLERGVEGLRHRGQVRAQPRVAADVRLPGPAREAHPVDLHVAADGRLEAGVEGVDVVGEELPLRRDHGHVPPGGGQVVRGRPAPVDPARPRRREVERDVDDARAGGLPGGARGGGTWTSNRVLVVFTASGRATSRHPVGAGPTPASPGRCRRGSYRRKPPRRSGHG